MGKFDSNIFAQIDKQLAKFDLDKLVAEIKSLS